MRQQNSQIFSQEALDKLRSPEKLDTMLPITTPVSWMALIAILVLLFAVVLWSIYGAFTVKADGMGLIMDSAGVMNVSHIANGKIAHLYVQPGMKIRKGDLIAHMEQATQSADTRMAQYGMGLASSDRDAMGRAYQYDAKRYQQDVAEDVYSDYDGIVDEVMVDVGTMVSAGTPICSVRMTQDREDMTGLLYIPVDKGKRVEAGMTIQLAPNGADVSQTGSLIGVVRSVSQYPITAQGIQQHLGNAQLAQWILQAQNSSLMEVTFDLVKDSADKSGYLWTSKVGEHKMITPGSFCTGSIIIERKPPIEKVFYKLSQWLRSR
ncbi:MAG: HlyD family efflux transporter periplasmic adaptor subunit [Selenomonadaceae bacterium]|nr:HlyD family efflux transporter periplasmic adaptor subunit [Selenomonadaceae bacterium]MBQ7492801.1 HlyD family efflux transporter periplasmic adaptor subunit [Selenomonadaceae bacterium]